MHEKVTDWNVVVSITEGSFRSSMKLLDTFGNVAPSNYHNVLVLEVLDTDLFMESLRQRIEQEPEINELIGHVMPLQKQFTFDSPEMFEKKAKDVVRPWLEQLENTSFHVRMHRRGFKGRFSSLEEEQFLDRFLMQELVRAGATGKVTFDDPDFIIAVETLDHKAGLSLWERAQRLKYPFLNLS